MKKVGILGGTFDPVHFGHLNLAISMHEKHHLDEIWWIPVNTNPLKEKHPSENAHRLAMLKLALEAVHYFKIVDIELTRIDDSFTIDTIKILKEKFPDTHFHLLLGDDALDHFMRWKEPEEIVHLAPPLTGARLFSRCPVLKFPEKIKKIFESGWTKIPLLEISATEIRHRLKQQLPCSHLVPGKVLDYIRDHQLYS